MTEQTDTMRRLGDVVDFPAKLDDIGKARQRFREIQSARHGWSGEVRCVSCGDTGRMPDDGNRPCYCARGQEIERRQKSEAEWHDRCPRRFRDYSLASHPNGGAVASVWRWIGEGEPRGQNLVLSGPVGTGKTGLAISALRALHLDGRLVRYGTVPTILDAMRPRDKNNPDAVVEADLGMRQVQRVRVLLMDDFGAEKETEWAAERLYMVINGRYERELPTIVTTNRTLPELRQLVGERTVSRLTEDAALVHVGGRDLRRAS